MRNTVVGGVIFTLLLFFTSFFGSIFFLAPLLPLIFLHPRWAREWMDHFVWMWSLYAVGVFEKLYGVKVVVRGQHARPNDSTLIIMNHRTRFDWLFMMAYQLRCGSLKHFKISLKDSLKQIPGPGWAMQCAGFLFLQRKWEEDEMRINTSLNYFRELKYHPQILLFPEGTDLTDYTKRQSDKFAEKHGMPKYDYVLHPRTLGFSYFLQKMREAKMLDTVCDITVAYPRNIPQNEKDMLKGNLPKEIHFIARKFSENELPTEKEQVEDWCKKIWQQKENFLKDFYEKRSFSEKTESRNIDMLLYATLIFWTVFEIIVTLLLIYIPLVRWYCLCCSILFIVMGRFYGGVEGLQARILLKR